MTELGQVRRTQMAETISCDCMCMRLTCMVSINCRWDMSKPQDHYWSQENARTLTQMKDVAGKSKSNYGCIKQPLLNIPVENIRVDELHLLLRITGESVQCILFLFIK